MFRGKSIKLMSNRKWYKKTKPYLPSQVTNYLTIANRLCHLGFRAVTCIPRSQLVILLELNNNDQGTSSTFEFLNHFCRTASRPVAWLMKYSFKSSWTSPILSLQPSNVSANYWETVKLKPSKFSTKTRQPFLSKSSRALSNDNNVWTPLGSILTIGSMANRKELTRDSTIGFDRTETEPFPRASPTQCKGKSKW